MNRIRFIGAAAFALATAQAGPALAQNEVVAQANPDADRLANDIRMLAGDPRDVRTLLDAGMTSARLGDTSAALAFFQRAEVIEPGNPRIWTGRGMALVRLERPGEALTLFQQAEARGVPASEFAADRAFAYDLLGQPGLAQRDYKLALAGGARDDETVRRYALSQGITGDREDAMRTLEPLLRRSDRAAWRARAFILAMNGDTAGAEKIAASMMPGTMGQALSPFFRRLASLGPADRAFAVHFGELSPTQARIADARLAPELPRYVPAPRPVQVAAVQPAPVPVVPAGRDRRSKKERERDEKLAAVAAARQPVAPPPQPEPDADLPPPPRFVQPAQAIVQPIPAPKREEEPVEVAEARAKPAPLPVRPVHVTPAPAPTPVTLARAEPVVQPVRPRPEPVAPRPAAKVGQEDSALASIVGGITIPAEELATVTAPPPETPVVEPEPVRVAEAKPVPAPKPVAAKPDLKKPDPKAKPLPEDAKKGTKPDPKAKLAAEDARKGGKNDPKGKKTDPKKPDPAKTDPSRIWVQVAGGANEDSLAKAWKGVVAKAPAAMKGKGAWTTPLRATNRVLAGPFKTSAEAQSFVNTLGKAGVSGFVFTSEAGQKVTKLAL